MGGLQASLASSWEHVYQVCSDRRVIEEIKGFFILFTVYFSMHPKASVSRLSMRNRICCVYGSFSILAILVMCVMVLFVNLVLSRSVSCYIQGHCKWP